LASSGPRISAINEFLRKESEKFDQSKDISARPIGVFRLIIKNTTFLTFPFIPNKMIHSRIRKILKAEPF
jgi:hypothetical protein